MMIKQTTFSGVSDRGQPLVEALRFEEGLCKTASAKEAMLHPELTSYIKTLKPEGNKLYVLVNAMGAGEYYGPNLNADFFGEEVLKNEDPKNGYKTFLNAGLFRHHRNKIPEESMGRVTVSVYNPRMHRVELVQEIDRAKAKLLGHQDLVDELDAGGHPPVSMGMRTPFDLCSICQHKSRTNSDRCSHILTQKNQTLPDGRRVYMVNPVFKAFDISYVLIGADRTSFAIFSLNGSSPRALEAVPQWAKQAMSGLEKAASFSPKIAKAKSSARKMAVLEKRVPAMSGLQAQEPSLPTPVLNRLGNLPRPSALATPSALGIVLKPREFQRITLVSMGKSPLADLLDRTGRVFHPSSGPEDRSEGFSPQDVNPELLDVLRSFMPQRSVYKPLLCRRVITITKMGSKLTEVDPPKTITGPLMDKIAQDYDTYRTHLIKKIAAFAKNVALQDPKVLDTIYPDALEKHLSGFGKVKHAGAAEKVLLFGVLPAMYLLTRAFQKADQDGRTESTLKKIVRDHPVISASVGLGLLRMAAKS